jgi:hypothetical protein
MKRIACLLLVVTGLISCGGEKKHSSTPETVSDFIELFPPTQLPILVTDTSLTKKAKDPAALHSQFVPDTVTEKVFGKSSQLKIYPLGRIKGPNKESFLLAKAFSGNHKAALLLCFDGKDKFQVSMTALDLDANPATQQSFSLDKKFTISKMITRKNADGTISDGKDVFVLNEPSRSFVLIMTDALDEKQMEMINPIDTLSKKHKFTGDYAKDKKNLISIRDNKKTDRLTFFVHFEKPDGCSGELKGEARFTSPNTVLYRSNGDPCSLQFNFSSTSVTMTELDGCGSHRDINCVFEGSFPKKKELKPKPKKKTPRK